MSELIITDQMKLVLCTLAESAGSLHMCEIARRTGLHVGRVKVLLDRLEAHGCVDVEGSVIRRRGKRRAYVLTPGMLTYVRKTWPCST